MYNELHGIWKAESEKKEGIISVSITRVLTDIKPRTIRCESEVLTTASDYLVRSIMTQA
jgi:hypothetical protein